MAHTTNLADGFYWLVTYSALWWLLTGGAGWGFGFAIILTAIALSLWLDVRPWRLKLLYLPRFIAFFVHQLVAGGWDVARRALTPRLPLDPAWVHYPLQCADPKVRLALSAMVGLLPGTLATKVEKDRLHLHVLDQHQTWYRTTAQLETRLANLLGATPS